jgi:hypothetical protein
MAHGTSGKLSLPLMIVAFLAVAGFVYWLSVTAQPTEIPVAEEEEPALELSLEVFQSRSSEVVGERVRLPHVEVASTLGLQAFWFEFPDGNIYLARIGPELAETGFQVEDGDEVRMAGIVREMNDEVLDAWVNQGVIPSDARDMAAFAQTFIEADEMVIRVPEEAQDPPSGN